MKATIFASSLKSHWPGAMGVEIFRVMFFFCLFSFGVLGLSCCPGSLCSCRSSGLLSGCVALTSRGGGFSWGAPALQSPWIPDSRARAWWFWSMGPAVPWHVGSSPTRGGTCASCIGRQILYHWATGEAPYHVILNAKLCCVFRKPVVQYCCPTSAVLFYFIKSISACILFFFLYPIIF